MKLTRRGLFKTLAGAFAATKAAPLLPVAAPPPMAHVSEVGSWPELDSLNVTTLAELNKGSVPDSFFVSMNMFPSPLTPLIYHLRDNRPWLFDGGKEIKSVLH